MKARMVATQKRRAVSHEQSGNTVLMLVGGFLLIGCFVAGLQWGGKSEGVKSRITVGELHHREETLRQSLTECNAAEQKIIDKSSALDESAQSIKDRNKKLDERNHELYDEHQTQENQIAKCQEETETQIAIFTDKDEETKRKIANLNEEILHLDQALQDLTNGNGMRTVLLHARLEKLKEIYERVVTAINETDLVIQTSEQLEEKHSKSLDDAEARADQMRLGVEEAILNWSHWRYNATEHTDIFLSTLDEDGDVIRPTALGRTGSPPVRVVRRKQIASSIPTTTVAELLVRTYDFAVCALRLQSPNFTFPNSFYWHFHLESDRSFLSNIVDTPLIGFCQGCHDRRASKEFQLACEDELRTAPYGGSDFWAARSRIRFLPHVEHEADNFLFANQLKGKKYLAVVLHSSPATYEKCEAKVLHSPAPHYLYIRGNFDEQLTPLSNDTVRQCSPTWDQMVERIKEAIKEGGDENPFEAVYLSIEPDSMERVRQDDLPGIQIVMMEQKNALDEAVDLIVASRSSRILVSPYLAQSQVVTEMFLLNHQLTPNNNVHFF